MKPGEKVLIPPHLTRGKGLRGVGVWEGGGRGWKVDWLRLPHAEGLLGARLWGAEEARRWREEREPLAWKALEEVAHLLLPEQREDAAKSLQAFFRSLEGGPAGFVLANGTGTGKTYVYGAFLRAVEAFGLEGLVVLPNSDLAHQTEGVLRLMGVRAETATYAKLSPEEAEGKVLVLDEAHLAKNHRASDRGRRAWSAVVNAVFTLFSSATPFDRPWEAQYLFGPTRAAAVWGYRSHYELLLWAFSRGRPPSPRRLLGGLLALGGLFLMAFTLPCQTRGDFVSFLPEEEARLLLAVGWAGFLLGLLLFLGRRKG